MDQPAPDYESLAPYRVALLSEPDSIRVLELAPDTDQDAPLQAELVHVRLSDDLEGSNGFEALSYVWGKNIGSHSIQIGTGQLPLGENLHSALCQLRRRDRPLRLWVDALCINQYDLTERNHQVHQMRDIYSSAQATVIFLGHDLGGNHGHSAWNYLQRHSTWALNHKGEIDYSLPAELENLTNFRGDLEDVEIDVLTRDWFRRVWVFQEVVVSKNLSVQCGSRRIAWDDFCRILLLSPRYHDPYGGSLRWDDKIEVVRDMFHARCTYQETLGLSDSRPAWHSKVEDYKGSNSHILNILARCRRLEASDARDKIYALLGISTGIDTDHKLVAVDYRKSWAQVYTDFARYILDKSDSHDLLSFLDWGRSKIPGLVAFDRVTFEQVPKLGDICYEDLPSWVPNWNRGSPTDVVTTRTMTRTILSTLEPESDAEKERRKLLVRKNRVWIDRGVKMVIIGSFIGAVTSYTTSIIVDGKKEAAFQALRDRYIDEPAKQYDEIMELWREILWETFEKKAHERERNITGPFVAIADSGPIPPKGSVEDHLISRARKTANWSDINNLAVANVTDKSSIIDGKRIAAYTAELSPNEGLEAMMEEERKILSEKHPAEVEHTHLLDASRDIDRDLARLIRAKKASGILPQTDLRLAILPVEAEAGDIIVHFSGARVPFVVRQHFSTEQIYRAAKGEIKEKLKVAKGLRVVECRIIGECVINDLETFDSLDFGTSVPKSGWRQTYRKLRTGERKDSMKRTFLIS